MAIRAGYNPDFRPFIWQQEGEPRGELADICRRLFRQAAIDVDFVALGLSDGQSALLDGDIDVLIGMAASPEREDRCPSGNQLAGGPGTCRINSHRPGRHDTCPGAFAGADQKPVPRSEAAALRQLHAVPADGNGW